MLLSADTDHSFWVPQLAGKTDLIPNRPNEMWIDPHETGTYVGQCAQYCGVQHAKMLLTRDGANRRKTSRSGSAAAEEPGGAVRPGGRTGAQVFEIDRLRQLPHDCRHQCAWQVRARPDAPDEPRRPLPRARRPITAENLRLWVKDPDAIKPGCADAGHATETSRTWMRCRLPDELAVAAGETDVRR